MHCAADAERDQSYFLFATTPEQLEFLRFPLGGLKKSETRNLARRFGLKIADKSDSQDICFVPTGHYSSVIRRLRPGAAEPGKIVHVDGRVIGDHEGIINYTIGQRRGIGVAADEPTGPFELLSVVDHVACEAITFEVAEAVPNAREVARRIASRVLDSSWRIEAGGDEREFDAVYTGATRIGFARAWELSKEGLWALEREDPQAAVGYLLQAIDRDPDFVSWPLHNLAVAYHRLGREAEALETMQRSKAAKAAEERAAAEAAEVSKSFTERFEALGMER